MLSMPESQRSFSRTMMVTPPSTSRSSLWNTGGTRPTMVIEARTRRARGPVECTEVSPFVRLVVLQKKLQGRHAGRRSGHSSVLGQAFWAGQQTHLKMQPD